uniref:Uncharacterized protein n=1 Tax=Solanum tuberosum TaxID=4113 RepID=M1DBK9_SOLTU
MQKALNSTIGNISNLSLKVGPPLPISGYGGVAAPEFKNSNSQRNPVKNPTSKLNMQKAPIGSEQSGLNCSSRVQVGLSDGDSTTAELRSQNWQYQTIHLDGENPNPQKALSACELKKRDEERKKYKQNEEASKKAKCPLDSPLELTGNSGMISTSSPIVVVSANLQVPQSPKEHALQNIEKQVPKNPKKQVPQNPNEQVPQNPNGQVPLNPN